MEDATSIRIFISLLSKTMVYIKRIKGLLKDNKTLIENFSYLSVIQILNILLPLATYPYLIRVLGASTYGTVIYTQAIMAYIVIFVNFGFDFSATTLVSVNRENRKLLSEIVSSVLLIKASFFLIGLVASVSILLALRIDIDYTLFYLTLWMVVYEVLFPVWYFQGLEKMKYITYANLVSRVTFVSLIFLIIKEPSDYIFLPIINGSGAILAALYALFVVIRLHKIKIYVPNLLILRRYFKDSLPIFVSNVSIKFYVSTNRVIVGAFIGPTEVAIYDLAEKLIAILKMPQGLLSNAIFPKISKDKDIRFVKNVFKIIMFINIIPTCLTFIFAPTIARIIGGPQMFEAESVIRILILTVPLIAMSNVYAIFVLLPWGYKTEFTKVVVASAILYFILTFILYLTGTITTTTVSTVIVIVELFVVILSYYYCIKRKLW